RICVCYWAPCGSAPRGAFHLLSELAQCPFSLSARRTAATLAASPSPITSGRCTMSRATFLALTGLVVGSVAAPVQAQRPNETRFKSGNILVRQDVEQVDGEPKPLAQHRLMRDQIDFGCCFHDVKYRRMAVTYFHPHGPLGLALAKFDW